MGIGKYCACFINTGARPAFYTVQFVKRKYQIVGREEYEPKMSETTYALGHSPAEIHRLKNQGAMLRPITGCLLRSAGIDANMRVLDLGCGAGDAVIEARREIYGPAQICAWVRL